MKTLMLSGMILAMSVQAHAQSTATKVAAGDMLLNLPFRSVETEGDAKYPRLHFRDVVIGDSAEDITVDLDIVSLVSVPAKNPYTTLSFFGINRDMYQQILMQRATVTVHSQKDFELWKTYLTKLKTLREKAIKEFHAPTRVVPPPDDP